MSDEKEKKDAAAGATAKKKGLAVKLAAPLGLVVAGIAAAQFLLPGHADAGAGAGSGADHAAAAGAAENGKPAATPPPAKPTGGPTKKLTYLLPNVLVNLANTGSKRYLKISIALECQLPDVGSEDETRARVDQLKSQFQDRVIEMLSARTVESLEGRESKVALKNEILAELDPILAAATEGHIAKLYYQEFVIQ